MGDGSDLVGVTRVQDIKYIRILRGFMQVIGAWPGKFLGEVESIYYTYGRTYVLLLNIVCLPLGLLYIRNNIGVIDFLELGHTFITVFINLVALFRLVLVFLKRFDDLLATFIFKIHLFNHRERSHYAMATHMYIHKVCKFFTVYIAFTMVTSLILFNGTPLYNNIRSGVFTDYKTQNVTFELSGYIELPFDYKHKFRYYVIVYIFDWFMTFYCACCFCILDLLMSLMVFHVYGHLRILINSLETFRRPAKKSTNLNMEYEWFSKDEMKLVFIDLRNIASHHNLIAKFANKMKEAFGPVLAVSYLFHIVNGCVLLLECSQMNLEALTHYGTLTYIVFQQMIQISTVFELLGTISEKLMKAVYFVPWECMDVSNRKIVHIILMKSQESLSLKALGMVSVGVQTMAEIIKASLSYFLMLRTVAEPNI